MLCACAKLLQSCLILCDPMDCSPPGSSVHGILQARILEWVAMPSSRGSSYSEIEPMTLRSPALAGEFFTTSDTWELQCYLHYNIQFRCSVVSYSATPSIAACQASLSITNPRSLLKLMSIECVMPSSHLILCHPIPLLPPIPPSIRVFSSDSTLCTRWPKYWSFRFNISPSNKHPGLISFRMD